MASASPINLFTSPEAADDPLRLTQLTADSIASLAAARIESGDLSADLASQLQEISQQLAASESQNRLTEAELAARAKALEREAKTLVDLRADFEASRDEWAASQKQLILSQKQWTAQLQKQDQLLQQRLDKLEACGVQFDKIPTVSSDDPDATLFSPIIESRISHQREAHLEAMLREAEEREDRLLRENRELEIRIESLSRDLEKAHGSGAKRLMREDYTAMADQLQAAQGDADRLRHELSHQDAELERLRAELGEIRAGNASSGGSGASIDIEALRQEWMKQAEAERDELFQRYQEREASSQQALEESARQMEEREASYQQALEEAARRLEELEASQPGSDPALEDRATEYREEAARLEEEMDFMKRRYEMAMSDLKELKEENETLRQNLTQAAKPSAPAPSPGRATNEPLDWEEEKRRLVAMLESDFQENPDMSPEEQAAIGEERVRIEDMIERTERIVQIKSQEIDELKALLQNQSSQVGNLAVGIGAFEEAFDNDELIVQERENLQRLQAELHDKLKKAEIEISLERAKVARERSEIDEMLGVLGLSRDKIKEVVEEAKKKAAVQNEERQRAINPKANKQANWFGQMGLVEEK